jgi:UDP-N-acetylmuramoyl-tripeptide--D-alanyl-D-alanine ligase
VTIAAFAVGLVALGVAGMRWLRVAQREHYIPGSCFVTARRWAVVTWWNGVVAALAVVTAVAGIVLADTVGAVLSIVAAILGAAFPVGMTVLGHEVKLKFTRRARTLAVVFVALAAILTAALAIVGRWYAGAGAAAVLAVPLVDLGLLITTPWEARSAARFQVAAAKRLRDVAPTVIAVTGSFGKTSTKNHIRDLAAGSLAVVASPASFNNQGGLSRTMNEHLTDGTELLVAEMGMYGPGEIRALCSWVRPTIGVITAIGPMHLERVGSLEGIVTAKAEILEGATTGVLWVDEPLLAALADRTTGIRLWRVGTHGSPALAGHTDVVTIEALDDDGPAGDAPLPRVTGRHYVVRHDGAEVGTFVATSVHPGNVACAVAAVLAAGVPASALGERLARLEPPPHRASAGATDSGLYVIDDTYNANPVGAAAAVERLAAAVTGKRAVVTPGLVELGAEQRAANERLGAQVAASGATLVAVGRTNRAALVRGATGAGGQVVTVARRPAARDWVRANLGEGDGVLWENDLPDTYP